MGIVAKYNLFKGLSTALTVGTPITTLAACSELFIHRSSTSISAAGVFAIFISLFFIKDKLMENFKIPSPFIICLIALGIILLIESIIVPIKIVCYVTLGITAVDSLTFRRIYKSIELDFPDNVKKLTHFGFIFASSNRIGGMSK